MLTNMLRLMLVFTMMTLLFPSSVQALTEDENNTINIYDNVHEGVVNITSQAVSYGWLMQPVPKEASGSGSILDTEGHILTNYHVIKNAQKLEVSLSSGERFQAKVMGADPLTDLAVIKIDPGDVKLTPITLGESDGLRIGQKVLAIGNPFGLEQSLSTGVISSIRKILRTGEVEIENVIQTDAAINPGNSGGPLLDSSGQQIGVNTAIFTPSGGNIGIGFAVPISTVKILLNELMNKGYVSYGFMGVSTYPLNARLSRSLGLPTSSGLLIINVTANGPAGKAGLLAGTQQVRMGNGSLPIDGDIIISANGDNITDTKQFTRLVMRRKPGDTIPVTILRNGKKMTIDVILGERPRN